MGNHHTGATNDFTRRTLRFEQLEDRYVFDAGLGVNVDLGIVQDGLVSDEFTVAGFPGEITAAESISLSDSSHVFIYGNETGAGAIELYARRTEADGTPGPPGKLLRTIVPTSGPVGFDAIGLDNQQFVVTWHEQNSLLAQIYDSDLNPVSSVVTIDTFIGTFNGPFNEHNEFLDVMQSVDGDLVFAYVSPEDESIYLQGRTSDLTNSTHLHWSSQPSPSAFNLELDEFEDSTMQLSWLLPDQTDPLSWKIETIRFDADVEIGSDSWQVDGFLQAPELEFQSNRNAIVAGVQLINGGPVTVIDAYDPNQQLIHSYSTGPNILPLDGPDQLVVVADNSYSMMLLESLPGEDAVFVTTFNAEGELIGERQIVNPSGLHPQPKGAIIGLENGGYATYWTGLALDEVSPALFSRTIRYEQSDLNLSIQNSDPHQDLAGVSVEIEGIPEDAGLNVGQRTGSHRWLVEIEDLDRVRLLTFDQRPSMNLTFRLVLPSEVSPLAENQVTFGSRQNDILVPSADVESIFGFEGFDQLVLNGGLDDYLVEQISDSQFRLTDTNSAVEFVFQDLEQFQVENQLLTLQEFLQATSEQADPQPQQDLDIVVPVPPTPVPAAPQPANPVPPEINQRSTVELTNAVNEQASQDNEIEESTFSDDNQSSGDENSPTDSKPEKQGSDSNKKHQPDDTAKETGKLKSELLSVDEVVTAVAESEAELGAQPEVHQVSQSTPQPRAEEPTVNRQHTEANLQQSAPRFQSPVESLDRSAVRPTQIDNDQRGRGDAVEGKPLMADKVTPAFNDAALFDAVDKVERELVDESKASEILVGAGVVVATGYSLVQIAWLLRSSAVLTKLMSSLPIWVSFDPLPLLSHAADGKAQGKTESLVDIVDSKS